MRPPARRFSNLATARRRGGRCGVSRGGLRGFRRDGCANGRPALRAAIRRGAKVVAARGAQADFAASPRHKRHDKPHGRWNRDDRAVRSVTRLHRGVLQRALADRSGGRGRDRARWLRVCGSARPRRLRLLGIRRCFARHQTRHGVEPDRDARRGRPSASHRSRFRRRVLGRRTAR